MADLYDLFTGVSGKLHTAYDDKEPLPARRHYMELAKNFMFDFIFISFNPVTDISIIHNFFLSEKVVHKIVI